MEKMCIRDRDPHSVRYLHSTIKFVIRDSHFDLYYLYSSTRQFSEAAKQKKIQKIFKVRKQEKKRA